MLGFVTMVELILFCMFSYSHNLEYLVSIKISKKWGAIESLWRAFLCLQSLKNWVLSSWYLFQPLLRVKRAYCFFCCTIWVQEKSQNRMNLEIYSKAVRNLGYDMSRNTPVISLPSIRVPNFIRYSWSLGTTNDEMMSEVLEGWNYMTRKRQVFPESQYECDRKSIGSHAWPYSKSIGERGICLFLLDRLIKWKYVTMKFMLPKFYREEGFLHVCVYIYGSMPVCVYDILKIHIHKNLWLIFFNLTYQNLYM